MKEFAPSVDSLIVGVKRTVGCVTHVVFTEDELYREPKIVLTYSLYIFCSWSL